MLQYDYNKITICLGNYQAEFEDFIQAINQIINAIYSIYIEDKEEYNMIFNKDLEILMKKTENNNSLECLINDEKINISIQVLLNEVNEACQEYFSIHSSDNEIEFEYDKYQKIKDLFRERNSYE